MSHDFNRLMSSNSIHNISRQETDTCDIEPWIEDWNDDAPKERRSHTTPSEFYQCLSNNNNAAANKAQNETPLQQQQMDTTTAASLRQLLRGMDDDDSEALNFDPTPWEQQQPTPNAATACWHLPTKTDMATPQANMLSVLRGRLRSIVLSKTKLELGPPENGGMRRAYKSHTDVNEEDEAEEFNSSSTNAKSGGGRGRLTTAPRQMVPVPKVIRSGAEPMITPKMVITAGGDDGTTTADIRRTSPSSFLTASHEKGGANRRQSTAVQTSSLNAPISFHDLSACLIGNGRTSGDGGTARKGFRCRAKSEAMSSSRRQRENIYKEKLQETEKDK